MVAEKNMNENLALRVESGVYIVCTHTTANSCRFTCKRANHIAIKPKAEPKQAKRADNIHNSKNEVMVSRKMHKVNTQIQRRRWRRFEQNLENGFFAEWTFYIWMCVCACCVCTTASIQFIHHQKFKKLPFLLFLPLNFISIPHISLYFNQPDFLLQFHWVHTLSLSLTAKMHWFFSRFYLLVVYRNHYLLFVRQTKANACSRGWIFRQSVTLLHLYFTMWYVWLRVSVRMSGVADWVRVFFCAFLYFVSSSYTNNKMYV